MRKYDYVRDGTPLTDEALAHDFMDILDVYEEALTVGFWATQVEGESDRPEDREYMEAFHLVRVSIANSIDAGTRNTVRHFTGYFTPEVCSMN